MERPYKDAIGYITIHSLEKEHNRLDHQVALIEIEPIQEYDCHR